MYKKKAAVKEFKININDAGQRLDRFAAKSVPLLPSSLMQKYIRIKRIKVNSKGAKRDYKLVADDIVQMYINDEFFEVVNEDSAYLKVSGPSLDIIYEDINIMLINKPVGVLCHGDINNSPANGNTAVYNNTIIAKVQAYLYKTGEWRPREENSFVPALCNRIDHNTSGIVIAAKNAEALRIINEKLKHHEIDRYYLAVVHGIPKPSSARLDGYIFKDAVKNRVYVTKNNQPGAKPAAMVYTTIESSDNLSLLECRLITGRTHQIRAQLANIGHPILGDSKYGNGTLDRKYGKKKQALCSYKLMFSFKTDAGILEYLNGQVFELRSEKILT